MCLSCTPERATQNSKQEWGKLVRLCDFALSLGRFVGLSGGICCKTQVNPGVGVDIKKEEAEQDEKETSRNT